VYNARCVIPARTTDVKVALLNTKKESQIIPRETKLREVHDIEEVRELDRVENEPVSDLTPPETEALKKIMEKTATKSVKFVGKIPPNYLYGRPRYRPDRLSGVPYRYR